MKNLTSLVGITIGAWTKVPTNSFPPTLPPQDFGEQFVHDRALLGKNGFIRKVCT